MQKYPKHIRNRVVIGHLLISCPGLLLCFGTLFFIIPQLEYSGIRILGIVILSIGGLALSWLFWASMIAKWRLWAFGGLGGEDMYLLKQCALDNYLIWGESSRIGRTEIRRIMEQERINKFENKIKEHESLRYVLMMASLPEETRYEINKPVLIFELVVKFALIILTATLALMEYFWFSCLSLLLLVVSGDSHFYIRSGLKNNPHLIISTSGISISGKVNKTLEWKNIVEFRFSRLYKVLSIDYKEAGKKKRIVISLSPYKILDFASFELALDIYRKRNNLQREIKKKGMDY